MTDFASNLKTLAAQHQHGWLASGRFADPKVYAELAKPGNLMAIKQAGFNHLFVDLPEFVGFINNDLVEGKRDATNLAKDIEATPSYSVHKSFAGGPVTPPEAIANLMLRAKEAGVELHFFGATTLKEFDGPNLNQLLDVQMAMKGIANVSSLREVFTGISSMNADKRKFMEEQLKVQGSPVAQYAQQITDGHMKQLTEGAAGVKALPAGERALIIQQDSVPLPTSLPQILGAETIGRIDAKSLTDAKPAPNASNMRPAANGISP